MTYFGTQVSLTWGHLDYRRLNLIRLKKNHWIREIFTFSVFKWLVVEAVKDVDVISVLNLWLLHLSAPV
jgi:hypothetical protein